MSVTFLILSDLIIFLCGIAFGLAIGSRMKG
jgi:hypothetical protein